MVGSPHPGAGEGAKGLAVRQLKWYVSWVQTVEMNQNIKNIEDHTAALVSNDKMKS
ncbi:MAG: hypothetical protein HYW34_03420 [Candidatus Brennerbacteria bacterium]|nr:hypothetical protein [Candidatus Brennerbacteria bacterium]